MPATVSLHLPTGWIELNPSAQDLVGELRRAVDVPADTRDAAVDLLAPLALELARVTAAADVVLVGFYAQAIEIDGSAEPFVITANVVLAVSPQVGGMDEVRAALETSGDDIRPVDLPAGAGVLSTGETQVSDPAWDAPVPARTRRYLVPIPGTDRMAALSFLTPNLDLADQFDEVFAAVAETLEFGWDGPSDGDQP